MSGRGRCSSRSRVLTPLAIESRATCPAASLSAGSEVQQDATHVSQIDVQCSRIPLVRLSLFHPPMSRLTQTAGPRVSVIIPAHNAEQFIAAALRSVLAQTLPAYEVIVVDDGSRDRTRDVVAEMNAPTIRCITQPQAGVSAARNRGLEEASGEFVAFLDADDLWRPETLLRHAKLLSDQEDVVFSFANLRRFDHFTGATIGTQFEFYPELASAALEPLGAGAWRIRGDAFVELVRFGEVPAFTPAMMFRRSLLGGIRFDETLRICEDTHFVLRAATRGAVVVIEDVLVDVRRHDVNATLDFSLIAINKLEALIRIRPFLEDPLRGAALEARISRAHFDVARQHTERGEYFRALKSWLAGVGTPAPATIKARSTLGLIRHGVRSARSRRRVV